MVVCVALAVCRYTFHVEVHQWTAADRKKPSFATYRQDWASIPALVSYMAKAARGTSPKLHCIVMDRYFTTVKSCRALMGAGFDCLGTINTMYGGIPKRVLWARDARREFGAMRFARSGDDKILLQQWHDRGTVQVVSTRHSGVRGSAAWVAENGDVGSVWRQRKNADGMSWSRVKVPCPDAVVCYQTFMGGVDLADQVRVCVLRACLLVCSGSDCWLFSHGVFGRSFGRPTASKGRASGGICVYSIGLLMCVLPMLLLCTGKRIGTRERRGLRAIWSSDWTLWISCWRWRGGWSSQATLLTSARFWQMKKKTEQCLTLRVCPLALHREGTDRRTAGGLTPYPQKDSLVATSPSVCRRQSGTSATSAGLCVLQRFVHVVTICV